MNSLEKTAARGFRIVTDWQSPTPDAGAAITAFWQRENAIPDTATAIRRLPEVVAHALTDDGEVAAVCTAVAMTMPRIGEPMYYYRCFVGRAWRASRLVLSLLRHAQTVLEAYAREHDFPCIGILMELENVRFGESMRNPVWTSTRFVYAGKSGRGLDLRVWYFRGARLKASAPESDR
ncbi:MAG: hypothetical protein ABIS07_18290 [Dokdonella sp.]